MQYMTEYMPDSYYEEGIQMRDTFERALGTEAEEWEQITGVPCSIELLEYVHDDQWLAVARINELSIRFSNLEDMREWLGRMWR